MRLALRGGGVSFRSDRHAVEGYDAGPIPDASIPLWLGANGHACSKSPAARAMAGSHPSASTRRRRSFPRVQQTHRRGCARGGARSSRRAAHLQRRWLNRPAVVAGRAHRRRRHLGHHAHRTGLSTLASTRSSSGLRPHPSPSWRRSPARSSPPFESACATGVPHWLWPAWRRDSQPWRAILRSTPWPHQLAQGAPSVWRRMAGGSTFAAAPSAATSVAATRRRRGTRAGTLPRPVIRSSRATSRARTGSGTTRPRRTSRALPLRRHTTTRSTSRCPDPRVGCPATGSATSTEFKKGGTDTWRRPRRTVHWSTSRSRVDRGPATPERSTRN